MQNYTPVDLEKIRGGDTATKSILIIITTITVIILLILLLVLIQKKF